MEFKQLECFVTVARKGSFSKSADVLFLSQPAITNNIQKLETELDTILFDRNKNITLTKSGKEFFPYALEMLNIRDKSIIAINEYRSNIEGVLEICASTIPEQYLLPHIISGFKKAYPKVLFSIYHKDSREVVEEILLGKTNFGFIGAKYPYEGIEYIDFFEDKLVLITSPSKDIGKDPIVIEDLIGEEVVLREEGSGTRQIIEDALKEKKLNLSIFKSKTISNSMEAIKKMVALDIGVSFTSDISVKSQVARGQLKQYEVQDLDLNRNFSLAYCNNRHLSPLEERFKDFIINWNWDDIDI